MKKQTIFGVCVIGLLLFTGCSTNVFRIHPHSAHKQTITEQQMNVTQKIDQSLYQIQVPKSWKVITSNPEDTTLSFFTKEGRPIGGLVLLRVERLVDIGTNPHEVTSLETRQYRVYSGTQTSETVHRVNGKSISTYTKEIYYCIYVPSQQSGYSLYFNKKDFNPNVVQSIVKTFVLKKVGS